MRALAIPSILILTAVFPPAGVLGAAASSPPSIETADLSRSADSTAALEAALDWGVGEMIRQHPELRVAVLDTWGPRERARKSGDRGLPEPVEKNQEHAAAAARMLSLPVVADDTFQSIWQACSGNPHADACLRHSGEGSLEVRHLTEKDDGTFEISLGLNIVVGGRDVNWGVRQGVTVAVEPTDGGWEVTREVSRVYTSLLYRPPGEG